MSTKKQQRREQREQKNKSEAERKANPVPIIVLSMVAAVIVIGLAGFLLRDNREPPWEGATWSEAHGHWH
jgi:hypothetical protein